MVSSQLGLPCSRKKLWPKRCFCWLFKRTYNVEIHIFLSTFFELEVCTWFVGNWILFKMSLGWEISDKVWESYAWSNFGWLFLRNPNLATFEFWWIRSIPWGMMINIWSNDEYHFKMLMLTKNLEVWLYVGHNWLLT